MSQKSSLPQVIQFVSRVLPPDKRDVPNLSSFSRPSSGTESPVVVSTHGIHWVVR